MAIGDSAGPEALGSGGLVRLALLAVGAGSIVDGALMAWVGPGTLLGDPYQWGGLPASLLLGGVVALLAAFLPSPARTLAQVRRSAPHLLPYAPGGANAAIFLLWVFSTVAIYQGCLDIFAGAHAGGSGTGVADPARLQLLIAVASAVFALLPIYLALALRWLIPMGRWADAPGGRDTYGTTVAEPSPALVTAALRAPAPSPALRDRGAAVATVTVAASLFVSIGIQLSEAGTAPIPPGLWFESQVALPIYATALALGILAVDQSVRGLERRFSDRVRPLGPVATAGAGPGFVQ